MKKALIVIDFINDIISENGKLAGKGYSKFAVENNVIDNTNKMIGKFRKNDDLIIFVKITFKEDYSNQPKNSKLFGKANDFEIFKKGTEGNKLYNKLDFLDNDIVLDKTRVSSFYKTNLENLLNKNNITDLYFSGVAIELAIESAVRDAHDRDYNCHVLKNCCASSDIITFNNSLKNLEKISEIV